MRGVNGVSGEFSTIGLIDMINQLGDTKEMTMIEIGAYIGESTSIFAENFKKVISIDPHLNYQEMSEDFNVVKDVYLKTISKYDNIAYINKTSDDALSHINENVNFVYIDGLHQYEQVKKDINNYKPLIKSGGFIGGHDYNIYWVGVKNAIDELLGQPDFVFKDTSWIKKV
jgi:predicted O-methyltransferase YrrM